MIQLYHQTGEQNMRRTSCPVSKVLNAEITLDAKLMR
jgi:hypothetical protein